jgi:opacity protein-like surface antigen
VEHHRRLAALLALACAAAPAGALAQPDALAAPPPLSLAQYYPTRPPPPPPPAAPAAPSPEPWRRRLELVGIAGYQVNGDVSTSAGHLSISDEPVYGAAVGAEVLPGAWAELMWLYSNPTVRFSGSPALAGSAPMQVATHFFQIGGTKGVQRGPVNVFGGATIGAALFLPGTLRFANGTSSSFGDTWRFAFTIGGGARVDLSRNIALRFDLRAAAPVYFTGGGFYAGSGGAGLTVGGGIPFWQGDFFGALVVML